MGKDIDNNTTVVTTQGGKNYLGTGQKANCGA